MNDKFLWVEKYRPQTIDECILPDRLKKPFQNFVDSGKIPNLILTGTAGVGKTTVARAMCEEIGADYILINGSLESGIDTLRVKIVGFASSVSLMGGRKVIIVDEADNLSNASQLGFRGVIEEMADNCTFIFTCNHINKILDAIHSRCAVINFKLTGIDKQKMASQFMSRLTKILEIENTGDHPIAWKPAVVAEIIMKYFPDYRRIINELQRYSVNGTIDEGILAQVGYAQIDELIKQMKLKDFRAIRQWVGANSDSDSGIIMREIFDKMFDIFKGQSVAVAVVLLGKYQDMAANVADQEINLMAFLTEILVECEFK
jgi:DNA polymerase III delta prime subunit